MKANTTHPHKKTPLLKVPYTLFILKDKAQKLGCIEINLLNEKLKKVLCTNIP